METNIGLVGTGRLGGSFALALHSSNILSWVCNKSGNVFSDENTYQFSELTKEHIDLVDIIGILTTDTTIEEIANQLSVQFGTLLNEKCIFHCSGSKTVSILSSLSTFGAYTAAIHPYQTFPYASEQLLQSIPWFVECDNESFLRIEPMLNFFKAVVYRSPRFLTETEKLQWHSSAVISSNFTATLYEIAHQIIHSLGIENSNEFIYSIAKQTIENANLSLKEKGSIEMSGPIVRGDFETVLKEIEALNAINPLFGSVFEQLSTATKLLQKR